MCTFCITIIELDQKMWFVTSWKSNAVYNKQLKVLVLSLKHTQSHSLKIEIKESESENNHYIMWELQ